MCLGLLFRQLKNTHIQHLALPNPVRLWPFLALVIIWPLAPNANDESPALSQDDLIGQISHLITQVDDTLIDLAVTYRIGFDELAVANPDISAWDPQVGTELVIPGRHALPTVKRDGIVINKGDLRLYFFGNQSAMIKSWPIGIGRANYETPVFTAAVTEKRQSPVWHPCAKTRLEVPSLPSAVPPGPNNPLGSHAIRIGHTPFEVHGTNNPYGIGRRVSRGCIRMFNDHVAELYKLVKIGTAVTIIDQPDKIGWEDGELYAEFHKSDQPRPAASVLGDAIAAAQHAGKEIDFRSFHKAVTDRRGIPVQITKPSKKSSHSN